jgi:hypothetical protein
MLTKSIINAIPVTGFLRLNKPHLVISPTNLGDSMSLFALLFLGLFGYVILDIVKNIKQNYKDD